MTRPADAPIQVLALDRRNSDSAERLHRWLGEDAAARLLADTAGSPYLLIISYDTGADPRFVHAVLWLGNVEAVGFQILTLLDHIECSPGRIPCRPIEFVLGVEPRERAFLDDILDRRQNLSLLRAQAGGHA